MKIIPQETEADIDELVSILNNVLSFKPDKNPQVYLFGSWASYKKSFTEGDVDIFVGVENYDYNASERLCTQLKREIPVRTKKGKKYPNRRLELHWGDIEDFLEETGKWERIDLTNKLEK